jgi:hypothetical protein
VADIIKTWPAFMHPKKVRTVFTMKWDGAFYFTMGRNRPKQKVEHLYYTHRGRIIGFFQVEEIVKNIGQLPELHSITGEVSGWQIKPDAWVAICKSGSYTEIEEKVYHEGFRGWRYFDFEAHKGTLDAKVRL